MKAAQAGASFCNSFCRDTGLTAETAIAADDEARGRDGIQAKRVGWQQVSHQSAFTMQPRLVQFDVPDEDTSRLRHELEGVGLGFEEHIQQTERFALLAADPDV
jgi:hypothetical protein